MAITARASQEGDIVRLTISLDTPRTTAGDLRINAQIVTSEAQYIGLVALGTQETTPFEQILTDLAFVDGVFSLDVSSGPVTDLLAFEYRAVGSGSLNVSSLLVLENGTTLDTTVELGDPLGFFFEGTSMPPVLSELPIISPGAQLVDELLEVDIDVLNLPPSVQVPEYQWLRDGVEIDGATSATYRIVNADLGTDIDVRVTYRDADGVQQIVTSTGDTIVGAGTAPPLTEDGKQETGGPGSDFFIPTSGPDVFEGLGGDDVIDGSLGIDTALFSGNQNDYTLRLLSGGPEIIDRVDDRDGRDTLIDLETLVFQEDNTTLDLTKFGGMASLSSEQVNQFIELYIAYFNRAPDALGLNFWGTAFANGTSLDETAQLFAGQPETMGLYPDGTTNLAFATQVYNNVLGRTPDQEGLDFWVPFLDSGDISRDFFILRVLEGAKADAPADATVDFRAQQAADQAYLEFKTDAGMYYSVQLGLSDVDTAIAVMQAFGDASTADLNAAAALADAAYETARDADTGEFIIELRGDIANDFLFIM